MRRVTLAARRFRDAARRPPPPRWVLPATLLGLAGGALLAGLVAGVWTSQHHLLARLGDRIVTGTLELTSVAGLTVAEVYVTGRSRTGLADLRRELGVERGSPLLAVDTEAARRRLQALVWVEQASVARRWPDVVEVRLVERRPLALWQQGGRQRLIDRRGAVIAAALAEDDPVQRDGPLRVVVGDGAPERAGSLFAMLSTEPALSARVVAATWVGGRRWDLLLDNDIEILLPERGAALAWRHLAATERDHALLARAVAAIDLRLMPDRMALRLDRAVIEGRGA